MDRVVEAKKSVPYFCILLAENALQVASATEKKFKKMIPVIFDSGFDARELRRYVKEVKDCDHVLMKNSEDEL